MTNDKKESNKQAKQTDSGNGNPSNPQLRTESVSTNPQSQRKSPQTQPGKRRTTRKEGKERHDSNR